MARSAQAHGGIIEGINVTPLVDIILVLLIIFMVTAKMIAAPAIPLDLPKAQQAQTVQTIFAVVLSRDGTLLVDGVAHSDEGLATSARKALQLDSGLRAVIQADRAVSHGRVMAVLDQLKLAGVERVAFGALAPEGKTPNIRHIDRPAEQAQPRARQ